MFNKPSVCDQNRRRECGNVKGKTERKLVFTEEKMQEAERRVASDESRRQAANPLGTNKYTLRKRLKVVSTRINRVLCVRF